MKYKLMVVMLNKKFNLVWDFLKKKSLLIKFSKNSKLLMLLVLLKDTELLVLLKDLVLKNYQEKHIEV